MRLARVVLALCCVPALCRGAELEVAVRDAAGRPARDAVVYALSEGGTIAAAGATAVMDQRDRRFIPHVLPVQTGTAVTFPNSDDVRHQVYSFSAAKRFQLPLYEGTPPNPVVFDTAGVVALGCNIHDRMRAYVVVVDTPHFASARDGVAVLEDLPAGRYEVRVWYPGLRGEPPARRLSLGASDRVTLDLAAAP